MDFLKTTACVQQETRTAPAKKAAAHRKSREMKICAPHTRGAATNVAYLTFGTRPSKWNSSFGRIEIMFAIRFDSAKNAAMAPMSHAS